MDLFTYLMAKKGHNTHRDLFSYLLGKNAGGSGTYTTFSGTSLNISNTLQAKIKNIAFEGNTSQDGTPTPEAPIPIKVVTGEQNVTIRNKNLFDYAKHNALTLDSNGRITTTKYYTQDNEVIYKLKPNTKYTFSFRNSNMGFSNYGLSMTLNGTWVQTNTGKYTLTSNSNGEFAIKLGADSYNTIGKASVYIQLEEGTQATEYVPYQKQTYPLSLGNIELAKIGNYKDYIFKNVVGSTYYNDNLDLNEWYLHKEMVKLTLTENSYWSSRNVTISGETRKVFFSRYDNLRSYSSMRNMKCNYFQVKNTDGTSPTADNQFYNNYERTNNLEFTKFDITTEAEWKEWVATHNIILIGKMVNPTNTKITDTTLIQQLENINNNARSYSDTTIIECTSESTDNETIGFSGDIKVTSVGLGNSLNNSLLSSNIQEETNIDDIQEEPNLDDVNEIEEIEEPIEEEVS